MKRTISHLHQELHSQKQTTEQLSKDKVYFRLYILHRAGVYKYKHKLISLQERELSIQRKQLRMERDQALDSLKERLIQV